MDKNWDEGLADDDPELLDEKRSQLFTRDASLFVIDAAAGMQEYPPSQDPNDRIDEEMPLLHRTFDAILRCLKRKAFTSSDDLVGVIVYNTEETKPDKEGSDVKEHVYCLQPIEQLNGNNIRNLKKLVDGSRADPELLSRKFKPAVFENNRTSMPIGNLYISCNRFFRNNPQTKNASKRIFHITCNDEPQKNAPEDWLTASRTNASDLLESEIIIEPFFIAPSSSDFDIKTSFDVKKFYAQILPKKENNEDITDPSMGEGFAKFDNLEEKLRKLEIPKRTSFTHMFELGDNFSISVKGYRTVVDQKFFPYVMVAENKKGELEQTEKETRLQDESKFTLNEITLSEIKQGFVLGDKSSDGALVVSTFLSTVRRLLHFADTIIRTFDLPVGLKLLGFQDIDTLSPLHNVGTASFIYPTEDLIEGSTRTFSALLKSCLKLKKLALVRTVMRKNAAPIISALLPQEEVIDSDDGSQISPNGFYLIPLPFADDLRSVPQIENMKANDEQTEAAGRWLKKLRKKSGYDPKEYENPYFRLLRRNIESQALDEPLDENDVKNDKTLPPIEQMKDRAGGLIDEWKSTLGWDVVKVDPEVEEAKLADVKPNKRKIDATLDNDVDDSAFIQKWRANQLDKCRLDDLKNFCRSHGLKVQGRKSDLIERISAKLESSYGK
ncbi:ATP-dependent DNA helicase ii [Wallemia mellicola]|nr:ATP-dependent DNA helicase ii [Wallemia mellicola]